MPRTLIDEKIITSLVCPTAGTTYWEAGEEALAIERVVLGLTATFSGGATQLDVFPQLSLDGAAWKDYYDTAGAKVVFVSVTANFTGTVYGATAASGFTNLVTLMAPLWRLGFTVAGAIGDVTVDVWRAGWTSERWYFQAR